MTPQAFYTAACRALGLEEGSYGSKARISRHIGQESDTQRNNAAHAYLHGTWPDGTSVSGEVVERWVAAWGLAFGRGEVPPLELP